MKKIWLLGMAFISLNVSAQNLFWSFNDEQQPMTIAPECDGHFDEIRGGVFMPTTEEVYQQGLIFLDNQSYEIKRQAPYCFLVAALNGNADAQFQLAQLYNKGDILPQDDLSAYKWSFIAALNGNKAAEKFTLTLEQFLTTSDLEATGGAIQSARLQIQENMQKELDALKAQLEKNAPKQKAEPPSNKQKKFGHAPRPTSITKIFTEQDRLK